jgi:hypothetical protein
MTCTRWLQAMTALDSWDYHCCSTRRVEMALASAGSRVWRNDVRHAGHDGRPPAGNMEDLEWNRLANGTRRRRVRRTYWHSPAVGTQEVQTVEAGPRRENEESRLALN